MDKIKREKIQPMRELDLSLSLCKLEANSKGQLKNDDL